MAGQGRLLTPGGQAHGSLWYLVKYLKRQENDIWARRTSTLPTEPVAIGL